MKKVGLMVVAALLSASIFANSASLPKKATTVNGKKPKTETTKHHKQNKPKGGISKAKAAQKAPKQAPTKK